MEPSVTGFDALGTLIVFITMLRSKILQVLTGFLFHHDSRYTTIPILNAVIHTYPDHTSTDT